MSNNEIDILIMGDNGLDTVGGEQESTKILIKGIKENYKVGVIQPGEINSQDNLVNYYGLTKKTRIKHLIKNPVHFISYIWKIKRIINETKPKVIHTQAQVSFFIVALLKKVRLISKKQKLIHTERGLYTKYNKFIKKMFFFFMKELNILVTTTKFNMKYWREALEQKGYSVEYKIIENTAGELFESYDESLANKNNDKLVVGFAGRYASWKNWPLAVEISDKLNDVIGDNLDVRMAVGCLDQSSLDETESMFDQMEALFGGNFEGQINISLEEMNQFYYDIDIFILTSKYNTESFGRTLVEAMSRKTAVLTTDAGGPVEVVSDLKNVCDTSDDFIKRILELYSDKEKMIKEKDTNLTKVRAKFSLDNNIRKHLGMYDEVIKNDLLEGF